MDHEGYMSTYHGLMHDTYMLSACVPQFFKFYASLVHVLFSYLNNWM